jgi:hydrogenase-4 component F
MEAANGLDVRFVRLAFLFALVGYGTKAGLAPMHSWVPDAYSRAPGPAAALLSSALGAASIAALLRFAALARATAGPEWTDTLLALFGVASMVVAVPFLVAQEETARLFAWSSVKHTGLVVLAVGLGTPMALFGGLFHLLAQACAKPLAFLVVGECTTRDGTRRIEEQRGLWARDRRLGVWMLIALAGAAGLPPAAGFVSQWLALVGGFTGPRPAFALVALAALAVGFLGLVRHGARLLMGAPAPAPDALPPVRASWAMGVAAMLLVGLGLGLPEAVRALIESAMQAVRP